MKKNLRDLAKTGKQFAYFFDNAFTTCEELPENATDQQKAVYIVDYFNSCDCENERTRTPNLQERIGGWLGGLTTDLPFYNDDIVSVGRSWGYCKNKRQENDFINNWWSAWALRIIQIANYYNLTFKY